MSEATIRGTLRPQTVHGIPVPGSYSGGVTAHGDLTGRDADDQHPISAITNLTETIEEQSDNITEIKKSVYGGKAISISETTDSRYLKTNGNAGANGDYQLDKYEVLPGEAIHITATGADGKATYQFQSNKSVLLENNPYIIGETVSGDVDDDLTVPTGATWLIISRAKTGTAAEVETILDRLKEIVRAVSIESFVWEFGSIESTGVEINSSARVRTNPVYCDSKLKVARSDGYKFSVYIYSDAACTQVVESKALNAGGNEYVTINAGYVKLVASTYDGSDIDDAVPIDFARKAITVAGYADSDLLINMRSISKLTEKSGFYRYGINWAGGMPSGWCECQHDPDDDGLGSNTVYTNYIAKLDDLVEVDPLYITKTELASREDGLKVYQYDLKPIRHAYFNGIVHRPIPKVIAISGQHGYEKGAPYGWYHLMYDLVYNWDKDPILDYIRNHVRIILIPVLNPFGFNNPTVGGGEINGEPGTGVNLNRNWGEGWTEEQYDPEHPEDYPGTAAFSELETQKARDLINANLDAVYFCDFHTNGSISASSPLNDLNWLSLNATSDEVNRDIGSAGEAHLNEMTNRFVKEFTAEFPGGAGDSDTGLFGHMTANYGNGMAKSWAHSCGIPASTCEGFNKFISESAVAYTANEKKANMELIVNWLASVLRQLRKE